MTQHTKGLLLTLFGVVLMSVESPLIKLSDLQTSTIGFFFGICLFISANLMLAFQTRTSFFKSYQTNFKGIVLSGLSMGFSNFCFIMAVYYTGIAKTVLILASSPIISALIALIFLKQHTPKRIYVATFIVFIGLYIILSDDLGPSSLIGNLFAFACVLSFSTLFCILSYYKNANRLGYISFGGIFLTLFSLYNVNLHVEFSNLLPILFLGLLITPLSRLFIGLGTRYLIPAEVGLLVIGESILAPIWGWWWLDEVISTSVFVGGGIILLALVFNSLASYKRN